MSRDLKHKRAAPSRRNSRGGTVLGIFIGLIIGILIALAVVWYMNRTPAPFVNKTQGSEPTVGPSVKNGNGGAATASTPPAPLPGKPGDAPQEKRFQFYDILPGKSEPKPDAKPGDKSAPAAKTAGPLALQVGSFQTAKDAENQRVNLTLMGLEPSVQEVRIADKTWFRVRVGPFKSFEELHKVKTELAKNGVQAAVVRPNE